VIYLDSSAIVKLARREQETDALRAWLAAHDARLVTSVLARTEAARVLRRDEPSALAGLPAVLRLIDQTGITDAILDAAADFPYPGLRSVDAIQLATAERLGEVLTAFIAYDKRLAAVAAAHGLPVVTPGLDG